MVLEDPLVICGHTSKVRQVSMVVNFPLATFCFSGRGTEQEGRCVLTGMRFTMAATEGEQELRGNRDYCRDGLWNPNWRKVGGSV